MSLITKKQQLYYQDFLYHVFINRTESAINLMPESIKLIISGNM